MKTWSAAAPMDTVRDRRDFTLIELLVGTACIPGCFRQKYEV